MITELLFADEITVTVSWSDGAVSTMNSLPYPADDDDPRIRAATTVNLIVACRALCNAVIERTGDLSALTAFDDDLGEE